MVVLWVGRFLMSEVPLYSNEALAQVVSSGIKELVEEIETIKEQVADPPPFRVYLGSVIWCTRALFRSKVDGFVPRTHLSTCEESGNPSEAALETGIKELVGEIETIKEQVADLFFSNLTAKIDGFVRGDQLLRSR